MDKDVKEAMDYLTTGGLGEVFGMAEICQRFAQSKVQMDTPMAMALCILAQNELMKREVEVDGKVLDGGQAA